MLLFGRLVGGDTDYDEGSTSRAWTPSSTASASATTCSRRSRPSSTSCCGSSPSEPTRCRGFQIGMVVLAVLTCLAAYLLGRAIGGPVAGLTAAALLTVAPPFPLFAHRVLADLPPLGIALVAFWLAWVAQERRSLGVATAGGAVLALAVAVKPNAVLALPPFLLLLLWERTGRGRMLVAALGGAGVVGLTLAFVYRDVLGKLWESVVVYHRDARDTPDVIDKWHELATFLNWRTPFAWLVVAGFAASVVLARRWHTGAVWVLWGWAAISLAFLAYHHPLHDNHLLILSVVLAVPAGIALGALAERSPWPGLAVGALALFLVAGYVQQQRRIVLDDVPEAELVAVARVLERESDPDARRLGSLDRPLPRRPTRRGPACRHGDAPLRDRLADRRRGDARARELGRPCRRRGPRFRAAATAAGGAGTPLWPAAAGGRDSCVLRVDGRERASGLPARPLFGRPDPGGCAEPRAQPASPSRRSIVSRNAAASSGGTSRPVTPSSTASASPSTAVAATGRPWAIASRATTP